MMLICGCSHFSEEYKARPTFAEANKLFSQGSYPTALGKYKQIKEQYPAMGDRALFEMGIIHGHPQNAQKDYAKALECFQQLVRDYPGSGYRQNSEMMIFYINNVTLKDRTIATQQQQNESLRQETATLQRQVKDKENEIALLQKKIEGLEQKISNLAMQKATADRILIEKKQRRLTLFSKGEVLKTYRIALGGNPDGPKERLGDNKTPEGVYAIDSRNRDSRYHLALHLSYPNERDKRRAKELGVDPGGNIMIHGLKNGFSYVGDLHTKADWTKGCIAVTDEEIAEIAKAVPNGTIVEIRP
nr:L,D-transpeptidase family protein [Geotalea sp. SG265]